MEEYLHDSGRAARDNQTPGDSQRGEVKTLIIIIIVMLCPDVLHCSSYYYP